MKIIAHIPARLGSERLPKKNLLEMGGKPLVAHMIEAASGSKELNEFYVNSESDEIGDVAKRFGASFYKRPIELGESDKTQEDFNLDFINAKKPDVLVLLNPVCPLIESTDIDAVIRFFKENSYQTVITSKEEVSHALYKGSPVNFDKNKKFMRTQDHHPIHICNWAIAVWDVKSFLEHHKSHGHASFVGEIGFYPLPADKAVKISTQADFNLAKAMLESRS